MTRNLKLLSMAVMVALAMSAVVASAASADALTSIPAGKVTLTGTQEHHFETVTGTTRNVDIFKTDGGTVECKKATYVGTVDLTNPQTTVNAKPNYAECTFAGFAATIDTNECEYTFHINGGVSTTGSVDVHCPVGKEITVTVLPGAVSEVHHPCS